MYNIEPNLKPISSLNPISIVSAFDKCIATSAAGKFSNGCFLVADCLETMQEGFDTLLS